MKRNNKKIFKEKKKKKKERRHTIHECEAIGVKLSNNGINIKITVYNPFVNL